MSPFTLQFWCTLCFLLLLLLLLVLTLLLLAFSLLLLLLSRLVSVLGAERSAMVVEVAKHTPCRSGALDGSSRSHADCQGFSNWSADEEFRYQSEEPAVVMGSIKTNNSNVTRQLCCGGGVLLGAAGQATGIVR
jgi:hypothetical protein